MDRKKLIPMKKIKSFNLRKVLVDELGTFARNLCSIVKPLVVPKQIPEPLVVGLEQGIKRYELGVGPKVDKAGTERSRQLDQECDNLLQAIKGAVRMAKYRPDQQEAAQRYAAMLQVLQSWRREQELNEETNEVSPDYPGLPEEQG